LAVVLDVRSMGADLKAFAKAAKTFLDNPSRLLALEAQLSNAASEAKRGDRSLEWTTDVGEGPILTAPSSDYRNEGERTKTMRAKISFKFKGCLDQNDDKKFVITSGGTKVSLFWDDQSDETSYHFDIHPGTAGHPMLHIQFNGKIKDVPRLHSMFAHPLDILEFTLMEIFQKKWRESRIESSFKNQIRKYPSHQQKRILSLLGSYISWVKSPDPALISLLRSPTTPIDLYPA
jgi:hypothetical protein